MKTSNKTSIGAISATIVTTIALFLSPVAKAADPLPLYSENFERASGGGNLPVSDFGWQAFSGSTAVNISTAGAPANSDIVAITPVAGNPGGLGALYSVNAATAGQTFAAVETFATGITIPETSTISWTMANASMDSKVRVLVQIGGNGTAGTGTWYASDEAFASAKAYGGFGNFSSAPTSEVTFNLNFTADKSTWREFTLTPGTSMSVAGSSLSSNLASNTITGVGFYIVSANTTSSAVRLDSLTITAAIPEPTSVAGVLGTLVIVAVWTLRRRKATIVR